MKQELSHDLMRAYLSGKLSPPEAMRIEKILRDDPDLQQELAILRAEMAASELLIASETRELFRQWQETPPAVHSPFKEGLLRWAVGIAISLLLLLTGVYLFRQRGQSPTDPLQAPQSPAEIPLPTPPPVASSSDSLPRPVDTPSKQSRPRGQLKNYPVLAAQLLDAPQLSRLRQRSKVDTLNSFQQAEEAFAAGNFQKTIKLLSQPDSTRQQSSLFLSAHALFQLQRYGEAESRFERLVTQSSRQFRFRSEWGLLMCRLADFPRREQAFRNQLNEILRQPEHPYWQQATALQKTLDD